MVFGGEAVRIIIIGLFLAIQGANVVGNASLHIQVRVIYSSLIVFISMKSISKPNIRNVIELWGNIREQQKCIIGGSVITIVLLWKLKNE